MKSLYNLLGVSEKAEKQEILNAYNNIVQNEIDEKKKNQLKIAVDILLDDEKRKRYDRDLEKMRAEELIKKVQVSNNADLEQNEESKKHDEDLENAILQEVKRQLDENAKKENEVNNTENSSINNTDNDSLKSEFEKIEEKEYMKALKKEERLRKKEIRRAKIEYQDAYAEAYHEELKKMGYDVKAPWTRKRIKNLFISIISTVLVVFIASRIPFVRNVFKDLYESNFIIKSLVDIFIAILDAIKMLFVK